MLNPLLSDELKRHLEDLLLKENVAKPNEYNFQQAEKVKHNSNQESNESWDFFIPHMEILLSEMNVGADLVVVNVKKTLDDAFWC